jgi:hypothetical protein
LLGRISNGKAMEKQWIKQGRDHKGDFPLGISLKNKEKVRNGL